MKLLYCPACADVFSLDLHLKQCKCGRSKGLYVDAVNAEVTSGAISVAIGNGSMMQAVSRVVGRKDGPLDRQAWQEEGKLNFAWVRPNEGPGNPHTKVNDNLGKPQEELNNV